MTISLAMATNLMHSEQRKSGIGFVTNKLSQGIRFCELALSSASTRAWANEIKNAQKAHYAGARFMHRFKISGHEAHRIDQRLMHLKTLLDELK
jgi:hypothetical protein